MPAETSRPPAAAVATVLVPRVGEPGRYSRRHAANARLAVEGGALVATDARGRRHEAPMDGSPQAPSAIGVVLNASGHHRAPVHVLVVLDRRSQVVVRDDDGGLWRDDDVRRFARAAGLRFLPHEPFLLEEDRARPAVTLGTFPWVSIALVVAFLPVMVVLGLAGVEREVGAAVGVAIGVAAVLAGRLGTTRMHPAPDAPEPGAGAVDPPADPGQPS